MHKNHNNSESQENTSLITKLYLLAAFIAAIIAVVPPLAYFWMSYQSESNATLIEAKLHAAFVTQVIRANPDMWQLDAQDLIEQELTNSDLPEKRAITGTHDNLIAHTIADLSWPVISNSVGLTGADASLVGSVKISRSLLPVLQKTAFIALAGITLGVSIFLILYTLPLRALKHTLTALHTEKVTALENEERLRVVIDNAADGIITLSHNGLVESYNAAAENIFGYSAAHVIGHSSAMFIQHPISLTVGHYDGVGKPRHGSSFPIEITVSEAHMKGVLQLVCIVRDITERVQAQEKLNIMANYDNLTGLPNRSLFKDRLTQALLRAQRNSTMVALLFLDLDRFKTINDTLGHDAGDKLLQHVAKLLQHAVRKSDTILLKASEDEHTVSRLGGDEFTIILEGLNNAEGAAIAAQNIITAFAQPITLGEREIFASTSIGIAIYPHDATDQENLIKSADTAMYLAKDSGRNTFMFYTQDLNSQVNNRLTLETELRRAIERNEFVLYYQPKFIASSKELVGVEALIRWQHPEKGLIPPDVFIPVLEESGLIIAVGEWVLRTACAQQVMWAKSGNKPLTMAVNLSGRQLIQKNLIERITSILHETGMEPSFLEFELTESILMQHTESNIATQAKITALGIRLSIDDFGTGYSSLSYLKRFSVSTLKIDRSFVNDLTTDQDDVSIVRAIIALANSLKMIVIAEGVETQEQLDILRSLGCHQVQGYFLGRPVPAATLNLQAL